MLGAYELDRIARYGDGLGRKHGKEIEWSAVRFPAGQAVADAQTIGLSPRLKPHRAARAAAFMDAVGH